MDSFICGSCAAVFHDVGEFLEHKKMCITASLDTAEMQQQSQQPLSVQATVLGADGKSTTFIIINGDADEKVCSSDVDATVNQLHNPSCSLHQNNVFETASCDTGILFELHLLRRYS